VLAGTLCRPVDVGELRARLRPRDAAFGIDLHASHLRKIDHQPAIAARGARDAVPTAAHRQIDVALGGEADGGRNITG
jgi:hypothetical protein